MEHLSSPALLKQQWQTLVHCGLGRLRRRWVSAKAPPEKFRDKLSLTLISAPTGSPHRLMCQPDPITTNPFLGKCFPCHGLSWWRLLLYFPSQPRKTAVRPKLSAVSVIRETVFSSFSWTYVGLFCCCFFSGHHHHPTIRFVREDTTAISYSCLSPCVYERDDQPGTAFCFAQGDQQVVMLVSLLVLSGYQPINALWVYPH